MAAGLARVLRDPRMVPVLLAARRPTRGWRDVLRLFPDVSEATAERLLGDLYRNHAFYTAVNERFVQHRLGRAGCGGFRDVLYLLVRISRPSRVIETGAWDGQSTAVMLQALADNAQGALISIDLPATEPIAHSTTDLGPGRLPHGCAPAWAVPEHLRSRLDLRLGDARDLLPEAARGGVDMFFHDSLHTESHMRLEFEMAWPELRPGGLLCSHDIFDNPAFLAFARRHGRHAVYAGDLLGVMRK
jgi:predicted O-methyltransferase YrrM